MTHENPETAPLDEAGSPVRSPRRMLLIMTAAALVVAVVVVVALVLAFSSGPGGADPSGSTSTPTASGAAGSTPAGSDPGATASPGATTAPGAVSTPAPPAPPAGPVIDSFSVDPVTAACADDRAATVPLTFSWASTGGAQAWIGVGTTDAQLAPTAEVATSADGFTGIEFDCFDTEQVYTLTVGDGTASTSSSVFVTRELQP